MPWTWNKEREDALKRLWTGGLSARDIAVTLMFEFGGAGQLTRSAVIGKKLRMGLRDGPERAPYRPRPNPRKPPPERKTARRWGMRVPAPPKADPRPLWKLEDHQCSYIVRGEGLSALYCGSERYRYGGHGGIKPTAFSWCYHHCHKVFKKFPYPPDDSYECVVEQTAA